MLRFSANLSMLFGEYDFLARFEKAAQRRGSAVLPVFLAVKKSFGMA